MQLEILSLPGPVVSMAGYKKAIAITVHLGLGLPGNQSIGITILTIGEKNHKLPYYSHLPLAPKSILSWIGFTDQGTVRFCFQLQILRKYKLLHLGYIINICTEIISFLALSNG